MKDTVKTDSAPRAVGPYSQAVTVKGGMMLFCSGQIALDPATGEMLEGTVGQQARLVMETLKAVVEAAGFSMEDIVKTTVFLTDMAGFASVNEVYGSFFKGDFPARSTVEVSALPRGALVEIEAIACK